MTQLVLALEPTGTVKRSIVAVLERMPRDGSYITAWDVCLQDTRLRVNEVAKRLGEARTLGLVARHETKVLSPFKRRCWRYALLPAGAALCDGAEGA